MIHSLITALEVVQTNKAFQAIKHTPVKPASVGLSRLTSASEIRGSFEIVEMSTFLFHRDSPRLTLPLLLGTLHCADTEAPSVTRVHSTLTGSRSLQRFSEAGGLCGVMRGEHKPRIS